MAQEWESLKGQICPTEDHQKTVTLALQQGTSNRQHLLRAIDKLATAKEKAHKSQQGHRPKHLEKKGGGDAQPQGGDVKGPHMEKRDQ